MSAALQKLRHHQPGRVRATQCTDGGIHAR